MKDMINDILLFIKKIGELKEEIIKEYMVVNNEVLPTINHNGFLVAPEDNYRLPPLKFVIGLPMAFKKGDILPFLSMIEYKNNYVLNKVTDKDLNIFEKVKVRYKDLNNVKMEELSSVGVVFSHGKIWNEDDEEYCYLYISGCISLRAKKELVKIMIPQESIKKSATKDLDIEGKLRVEAKLLSYNVEERRVSDQKTEKRYVGIFNTKEYGKITGTVAKKFVDLYDGNLNAMLGKNIVFSANFKKEVCRGLKKFSHPVGAEILK